MIKANKALFLCLLCTFCFTVSISIEAKEIYGYVTVNKLFIRSEPSLNSKKLGSLTTGDKITIISRSPKKETVAGKNDYWLKFEMGPKKGWVFGGFVSMKPVYDKATMINMLQGTYVYYDKPGGYQSRMLIIKGDTYIERWFDSDLGISDEFTGSIVYQAFDVILIPKTRKSRPSVYIQNPQNDDEENIYAYAYRMYDDDPSRLQKISRLKVNDGYKKLVIMVMEKIIFLVDPDRKSEIERNKITNATQMYPAYKRY